MLILTEYLNNNTLGKVPRQMLSYDVKIASMLGKRLTDQGVLNEPSYRIAWIPQRNRQCAQV